LDFQQALKSCSEELSGLAEVHNSEEQQYLESVATENKAWIGVTRCSGELKEEGDWCYTGSRTIVAYTSWESGEPNNYLWYTEDCVQSLRNGKWNDVSCSTKIYYVCQKLQCNMESCQSRGRCTDSLGSYNCSCNVGFFGGDCEQVVSCPSIRHPRHGAVTCNGAHGETHFESVCAFKCEEGFVLYGEESTRCLGSGNWSFYNTTCQDTVVSCLPLKTILHSVVNCSNTYSDYSYNSTCCFSCEKGHSWIGSRETVCQSSGNWTD
uniref:C-type lectin domain-containing protein n=1 Tax=Latimeria chalumnae TaxID=7897 RepID=H3B390_LATCH